jgi:hypothetical protein
MKCNILIKVNCQMYLTHHVISFLTVFPPRDGPRDEKPPNICHSILYSSSTYDHIFHVSDIVKYLTIFVLTYPSCIFPPRFYFRAFQGIQYTADNLF